MYFWHPLGVMWNSQHLVPVLTTLFYTGIVMLVVGALTFSPLDMFGVQVSRNLLLHLKFTVAIPKAGFIETSEVIILPHAAPVTLRLLLGSVHLADHDVRPIFPGRIDDVLYIPFQQPSRRRC